MIRIFSHYIPIRTLFLLSLETLVLVVSIYFGLVLNNVTPDAAITPVPLPIGPTVALLAAFIVITMTAMGLYDSGVHEAVGVTLLRLMIAFVLGLVVASLAITLVPALSLGTNALVTTFTVALVGSVATRLLFVYWVTPRAFQKRILVLGTGSRAASVEDLVKAKKNIIRIVGYLPTHASQNHVDTGRILSRQESLLEVVRRHRVTEIVVAVRDRRGGVLPVQELLECRLRGIAVTDLASFFERERCQLHLESLNTSWMIFGEGFRQGFVRETVKRFFDVAASGALVLLTLPVMLLTALAIYLEDGAPILYRQERVGQGGRVFTIFKFRSMRTDAEGDGRPQWAGRNDDRTTTVGSIIRKLRIDELPQILNVLRGDMSFVGPRPERPFFVEQLASKIPYYGARHSIKPGITGWAQVRYPYGASLDDAVEKLQYDLYYVKNHTLFLDIMVLIETVQVVLWGKGAR
ncbi:MAG: TIGR03013 family PEP-CTERM/XrtA system glycosyltransferase [Betaproteobacteria bacterium]|nr:MAG: TIGR03013 family PEP-CTERM/XrtA system glycosyltransferase [Betaproteobacteria bacterium]